MHAGVNQPSMAPSLDEAVVPDGIHGHDAGGGGDHVPIGGMAAFGVQLEEPVHLGETGGGGTVGALGIVHAVRRVGEAGTDTGGSVGDLG